MRLRLVADDLTGALDTAAQFCGKAPVPVFFALDAAAGDRAAVDIASRERSPDEAVALAGQSRGFLRDGDPAFKKIDSLLRGNWAAELKATLTEHFRSCVLAPAFPSQGRVTSGGRQWRLAPDGTREAVGPDIPAELSRVGLSWRHGADAGNSPAAAPVVLVFDATADKELSAVIGAGKALLPPVLWCGSAGLAKALAAERPSAMRAVRLPLVAIVGSHHPVSDAQIAACRAALDPAMQIHLGDDVARGAREVVRALSVYGRALVTFDLAGMTPLEARAVIDARLANLLPGLARPATLVATGGETLRSICRVVGANSLAVSAEFAPGIPVSTIRGGAWDGTGVISKSGAYGGPDLLVEAISGAGASQAGGTSSPVEAVPGGREGMPRLDS